MQYKINYKNQYGGDIKNILVYCHPKKITMENNNHWMMEIFKEIINDNYPHDQINFDTIDILPGGTIQDNVFSPNFINEHLNKYDGIFIPDCAGPWYYLQNNNFSNQINQLQSQLQYISDINAQNQIIKRIEELKYYNSLSPEIKNDIFRKIISNITKMLKNNGILFISKIMTDINYGIILDVLHQLNFKIIDKNFILYEESYSSPFIYAIKQ